MRWQPAARSSRADWDGRLKAKSRLSTNMMDVFFSVRSFHSLILKQFTQSNKINATLINGMSLTRLNMTYYEYIFDYGLWTNYGQFNFQLTKCVLHLLLHF